MKKQNRLSKVEEISMIKVQIQNLENEFQLYLSEKRQAEKYYRSSEGDIYDAILFGYSDQSSKSILSELRDILIEIQHSQSYLENLRQKSLYYWNMESENQRKQK